MQQTEQYGLNQWELTDRIQMADFNADNAKIAAALAGKLGRIEKIFDSDPSSTTGGSTITAVSNWDDWELYGSLFCADFSELTADDTFGLELVAYPKDEGQDYVIPVQAPASVLLLFFPQHDKNRTVRGVMLGGGTRILCPDFPYRNFHSIRYYAKGTHGHQLLNYTITHFGIR